MKKILMFLMIFYSFQCFSEVDSNYLKENFVLVEGGILKVSEINKQLLKNPNEDIKLTYNYYVAKYEFTQGDWKLIFGKSFKYNFPYNREYEKLMNKEGEIGNSYPINFVSWFDVIKICNKLSEIEKIPVAYDKKGNLLDEKGKVTTDITKVKGYRLLTWAEWQFAAQGGNKSKGFKYSGGNSLNEVSWNYNNSLEQIHEVGLKKTNELGLYDMTGNVSEMCTDYLYSKVSNLNPIGFAPDIKIEENHSLQLLTDFKAHVAKGGSVVKHTFDCKEILGELYSYQLDTKLWIGIDEAGLKPRSGIILPWELEQVFYDKNYYTGFRVGKTAN